MEKQSKEGYPWIKWFFDDHVADTGHTTPLEEGLLMRLYRLYYRDYRGPLPDDVDMLCRKIRARTPEEKQAVSVLLSEFFYRGADGLWHHRRCDKILAEIATDREQKSNAGKDGAKNRQRGTDGRFATTSACSQSSQRTLESGQHAPDTEPADIDVEVDIDTDRDKEIKAISTEVNNTQLSPLNGKAGNNVVAIPGPTGPVIGDTIHSLNSTPIPKISPAQPLPPLGDERRRQIEEQVAEIRARKNLTITTTEQH